MSDYRHIIVSAGRSCFVRCLGCYNYFGRSPQPTATPIIVQFLGQFAGTAVNKVTIGGGDPLSRPDILALLDQVRGLGFRIHMDTVGTPLLGDAQTIFYGNHTVKGIDAADLQPYVDLLGVPLDGSRDAIATAFRTGRANFVEGQRRILELTERAQVPVCVNTVVNRYNLDDLAHIAAIIGQYRHIREWQLFQFMPIGPLGYKNRELFLIDDAEYQEAVEHVYPVLEQTPYSPTVVAKSRTRRKNLYLLIDSDGTAWTPQQTTGRWHPDADMNDQRTILGNIHDRTAWPMLKDFVLNSRTLKKAA